MTSVWVAAEGMDSEGDMVLGVCLSAESGMALASAAAEARLEWSWLPGSGRGCWYARDPGRFSTSYYSVEEWEVTP